jgi:hypothetical protein
MATDTIRTLLAHDFPGADIAVDDRTGGGDHRRRRLERVRRPV